MFAAARIARCVRGQVPVSRSAQHLHALSCVCSPAATRWLSSEVSSSDDATSAGEVESGSPTKTNSAFRSRMMGALRQKEYALVLSEYEEMVQASVAPDMLALNCIIEATAHSQGAQQARETLQELLSMHPGLKPNANTYVALMRPLASRSAAGDATSSDALENKKLAFSLYEELLQADIPPDHSVYNLLIATCGEAKDFEAAEGVFDEMREKGVKPKSMSYLRYIYAAFAAQQPELAYKMLLSMEAEWRIPTGRDYTKMMGLFRRYGHTEGKIRCVRGIMADMRNDTERALSLDADVVNGLFRDAQERRKPEEVVELAETFVQSGIKLDRFQRVGVIFAHLSLRQAVKAFGVLIDLYADGYDIPEKARQSISEDLAKQASTVDESYYLLESRRAEGLEVPLAAVNIVIDACAVMGDLDRAFATWAELEQLGLKPNAGTYNALLHTCIRTRELASGRRLLGRMAEDGIQANAETYERRCALHIMSKEHDLALKCLDQCKDAQLVPPARMYVSLINSLVRRNNFAEAQAILSEMESHHTVTPGLKKKVVDGLPTAM